MSRTLDDLHPDITGTVLPRTKTEPSNKQSKWTIVRPIKDANKEEGVRVLSTCKVLSTSLESYCGGRGCSEHRMRGSQVIDESYPPARATCRPSHNHISSLSSTPVTLQTLLPRQFQMATESYYWTVTGFSTSLRPASLPTKSRGD
jgi:hypothetical protein